MRMDENVNPEWKRQCQGSASGRKALQEVERLTAVLDRLARLGNEPHFGNSDGNMIARAAIKGDDRA